MDRLNSLSQKRRLRSSCKTLQDNCWPCDRHEELVFQLLAEHLFYTGIDVGRPPSPNPNEELLNEITLAAIEPPFGIGFATGNGQRQQLLTWNEPVTVHPHREGRAHALRQLEPGSALLTVGYTRAIHTGLCLKEQRILARWPQGHSFIYLLWTDLEGLFQGITDPSTWLNIGSAKRCY